MTVKSKSPMIHCEAYMLHHSCVFTHKKLNEKEGGNMQPICVVILITLLFRIVGSVTKIKVGYTIVQGSGSPFDKDRVDPAVDIAVNRVNREFLNTSYKLVKLERNYGQLCSGTRAAGKIMC